MLKRSKVVENASQGPNVNRIRIKLMLYNFRCEVYWSSHPLRNELVGIMNYFAHSQVPNLDFALLRDENVLQFEVSVDDAHLVKIFDSIDQRSKNSP